MKNLEEESESIGAREEINIKGDSNSILKTRKISTRNICNKIPQNPSSGTPQYSNQGQLNRGLSKSKAATKTSKLQTKPNPVVGVVGGGSQKLIKKPGQDLPAQLCQIFNTLKRTQT